MKYLGTIAGLICALGVQLLHQVRGECGAQILIVAENGVGSVKDADKMKEIVKSLISKGAEYDFGAASADALTVLTARVEVPWAQTCSVSDDNCVNENPHPSDGDRYTVFDLGYSFMRANLLALVGSYLDEIVDGMFSRLEDGNEFMDYLYVLEDLIPRIPDHKANIMLLIADSAPLAREGANLKDDYNEACEKFQEWKLTDPNLRLICIIPHKAKSTKFLTKCGCHAYVQMKSKTPDDLGDDLLDYICGPTKEVTDPCVAVDNDIQTGKLSGKKGISACKKVKASADGKEEFSSKYVKEAKPPKVKGRLLEGFDEEGFDGAHDVSEGRDLKKKKSKGIKPCKSVKIGGFDRCVVKDEYQSLFQPGRTARSGSSSSSIPKTASATPAKIKMPPN